MAERDITPDQLAKIRTQLRDEMFGSSVRVELRVGLQGAPSFVPAATLSISGGTLEQCQALGLTLTDIVRDILTAEIGSKGPTNDAVA